jgi:hypothetical protein
VVRKGRKEVERDVAKFISARKHKLGGVRGSGVDFTDFGADLEGITQELIKKVCPTAVAACATVVRKEATKIVRTGGSATTLGQSKKTKTRGVLPYRGTEGTNEAYLTNAGKGAWFGTDMIAKRGGAKGPSLGQAKTIIKKPVKRKAGGVHSSQIVGPRYAASPLGKNFAHMHEMPDGSTPNHKWWGRPARRKLPRRPFMGPAGRRTERQQRQIIKDTVVKWKTRRPDLDY